MNIMKMMKQVQQMQTGLAAVQEKLASQTVTTEGAGGKLKVTATCDGNLTELVIDPSIIDPSDSKFLQELLLQTINAAIAKGKETAAAEMKKADRRLGSPSRHGLLICHHSASAQKTQTSGRTSANAIRSQPLGNSAGWRLSVPVGHRRHYFLDRFRHDGFCNVTAHMGLLSHFSFPALIAWLVFGSRIGLLGIIVWVAYGIVITDFLPPIARTGMEYYKMPPSPDARQIRVLTLYEGCEEPPPIEQISKLRADVIFVQGCSNYNRTLKFAYSIFGRTSYIKQIGSCAIIVRHGQIGPAQSITDTAGLIVDWIPEKFLLGDSAHQHQSGTF